jgi:hypothetical protein
MAIRIRDRVRLAEEEEEEETLKDVEGIIPPKRDDTMYKDWSESELRDVRSR